MRLEVLGTVRLRGVAACAPAWVAAVLLAVAAGASSAREASPAGVLDLRSWDFERDGLADLAGDWSICWDALLTPDAPDCATGWAPVPVPALWSEPIINDEGHDGHGAATYRLRVLLPDGAPPLSIRTGAPFTAYRLWVDGVHRGGSGTVAPSPDGSVAQTHNRVFVLGDSPPKIELLVQVSNHEFRGGGLRRQWLLGTHDQVRDWVTRATLGYGAFAAVCFVVGLIYLVQFALRPQDRVRGYFGLAALTIGFRVVVATGTDLRQLLFPELSFASSLRVEYLTTSLMIVAGAGYFAAKVRDVIPLGLTRATQLGGALTGAVAVVAPLPWVLAALRPIEALALVAVAMGFVGYAIAARRGQPFVRSSFIAISLFGLAVVHDIVRVETGFGAPAELFSFFMVVWLVTEAWGMSRSFAHSHSTIQSLSQELLASNRELRETNAAVTRFVPYEFLERLDKSSLAEVELGDHVEADMNVMFCDIRSFTGLVEGMRSEQAFAFINEFLQRMEPVIHARGGFVNQYLGDCIMALFPAEGDAAVQAGIEMTAALRSMNRERGVGAATVESEWGVGAATVESEWGVGGAAVESEIRMGIGVNAGSLMLGTIGGTQRLSGGVIGDAVNIASRVESLTKVYSTPFVITSQTVESLVEPGRFALRELDRVTVRGRRDEVSIFEVLDALDGDSRAACQANLPAFAEALALYRSGEWSRSRKLFEDCTVRDPADAVAALYVERCREATGNGAAITAQP